MKKIGIFWIIVVLFAFAAGPAWAEAVPGEEPVGFSRWLWSAVVIASLGGLGVFYWMHKNFMAYDFLIPLPASIFFAAVLILVPPYFDSNIYGWFGRDCFQDYIVSSNRVQAQGIIPANCVNSREAVSALGISFVINHYKTSFLDDSPLTTTEILVVYGGLVALWSLALISFWLFVYRTLKIK